jgi:predicted secreted protein
MAASDGQLNGTELGVYVGANLIAYSTNATININHSTRNTSSKESGGWEESMEGMRSWDVTCDALYAWLKPDGSPLTKKSMSVMFTDYIYTRATFELTWGSKNTSGDGWTKYVGDAWLTSASITAATEETATFSVSFQGTGPLVQTIDTTP